jgi:hypothetical protein
MIYASSFLKIFRIAEVLVLDFRKLTESQKLWFQFFLKKYNHQKNLQFWVYFENCWSRVPCTRPYTLVLYLKKERTAQHWFNMEDRKNADFKWDLFCRTQNGEKEEGTKPHLRNRNAS